MIEISLVTLAANPAARILTIDGVALDSRALDSGAPDSRALVAGVTAALAQRRLLAAIPLPRDRRCDPLSAAPAPRAAPRPYRSWIGRGGSAPPTAAVPEPRPTGAGGRAGKMKRPLPPPSSHPPFRSPSGRGTTLTPCGRKAPSSR